MEYQVLMDKLEKTGVLQKGHFLLSSGLHSNAYLQCAKILQYPQYAQELGLAIAEFYDRDEVDVVIGPALGGVILAHEVARALGCPALFAERADGIMQLRRGFKLEKGQRVLIVEDVVTTGGSVMEVADLVEKEGAKVMGIASIVDRSNNQNVFPYPFTSLIKIEVELFSAQECPLCQQGEPLIKPGSRQEGL